MFGDNHDWGDAITFEKVFLETVLEKLEKRGFGINGSAKETFPEEYYSDAARRFRAMMNQHGLGKSQRITLTDAYMIAKGLEMDLAYLIFIVVQTKIHEAEEDRGTSQKTKPVHEEIARKNPKRWKPLSARRARIT